MRLILRNLGFYLLAFWASLTLNFVLPRFMPGDPVSRMFAQAQGTMQPDQIAQLRKLFGLDHRPCGSSTSATSRASSPATSASPSPASPPRSPT